MLLKLETDISCLTFATLFDRHTRNLKQSRWDCCALFGGVSARRYWDDVDGASRWLPTVLCCARRSPHAHYGFASNVVCFAKMKTDVQAHGYRVSLSPTYMVVHGRIKLDLFGFFCLLIFLVYFNSIFTTRPLLMFVVPTFITSAATLFTDRENIVTLTTPFNIIINWYNYLQQ